MLMPRLEGGPGLDGVLIWCLTIRRWLDFLKKALKHYDFDTLWPSPWITVPWGRLALLAPPPPTSQQWPGRQSHWPQGQGRLRFSGHEARVTYVMLYGGEAGNDNADNCPSCTAHSSVAMLLGQSPRRDNSQGFLLGIFRKKPFNRK